MIQRQDFKNKINSINSNKGNDWHKKTFGW